MSDVSDWRCPDCRQHLHMGRDRKRNQIVLEYALEKALNTGVTL